MLGALMASGCEYAADPEAPTPTWHARCLLCRQSGVLVVREPRWREPWEEEDPPAQVWCRAGCAHVSVVRLVWLPVAALEWREQARVWRARFEWLAGVVRRRGLA